MKHGCRLHAYVLMTNHVHLLMTPNSRDSIEPSNPVYRALLRQLRESMLWKEQYALGGEAQGMPGLG